MRILAYNRSYPKTVLGPVSTLCPVPGYDVGQHQIQNCMTTLPYSSYSSTHAYEEVRWQRLSSVHVWSSKVQSKELQYSISFKRSSEQLEEDGYYLKRDEPYHRLIILVNVWEIHFVNPTLSLLHKSPNVRFFKCTGSRDISSIDPLIEKKHFQTYPLKVQTFLQLHFIGNVFNKNCVLLIFIRLYSKDWNDFFQRFNLIKVSQNINKRF